MLSEELDFGGRRYKVDGAYVHRFSGAATPELRDRDALRLTVTTRLMNMPPEAARDEMPGWMSLAEPTYDWYLFGGAGDSLADCFARGLEASLSMERRRDLNNYEQSRAINARLGLPGDQGGRARTSRTSSRGGAR